MVIVTVVGIIIHPEYLYKDKRSIKGEYKNIKQFCQTCNIGENEWLGFDEKPRHFNIFYMNTKTGKFIQEELSGFSAYSNFGSLNCPYYYDETTKSCFIILMKNSVDYYLIKIQYNNGTMMTDRQKIYSHSLLTEISSETCYLKGKHFTIQFAEDEDDLSVYNQGSDKYQLTVNPELFKEYHLESHDEILGDTGQILLNRLNTEINSHYTENDLNKLLMHNSRRNYFKAKIENSDSKEICTGYYGVRFIKTIDGNNDGNDDLLFSILGDRYLYSKLICYDITNKEVLWERDFAPKLLNLEIVDVNDDGLDEIIFSSYSPCSEMPVDFKDHQESLSTQRPYLVMLTNEGKSFEIDNQPVVHEFNYGFCEIKYDYIPELNGIIFGFGSPHIKKDKPIFFINLETNELQELEQSSSHILKIIHKDDRIKIISLIDGFIEKKTMDYNFKTLSKKKIYVGLDKLFFYGQSNILGKNYYIFSPFLIVSEDMDRCITDYKDILFKGQYQYFDNTIYFFEKLGGHNNFSKIVFTKSFRPNPYLIILLLTEFLIIALYYFVNLIISIPISSSGSILFVVYCYFGRFYHWKLFDSRNTSQHLIKHYSRSKNDVKIFLETISDNPTQVFKKIFPFFKYFVFEIPTQNEMEIIRRIAHDLKNQLLVLKFMNDQTQSASSNSENNYQKDFSESLKILTQNVKTLSNFSHIDKLYFEQINLRDYLEELIISYINHQKFENIIFIPETIDISINLDKNLFRIAFDNLLTNALDEINLNQKQHVNIELTKEIEQIKLIISNPVNSNDININDLENLGYTTKENGSGLGISISRAIIEKHHGRMDYNVKNNRFILTIQIPIVQAHKETEMF